ncbi:cellulose biosynthesis protein BcsR [Pantoea sp. KPR_PJ]|uniref:cellulose biosynthesis protein BcsR n=1 Tax=Pantoea sp. KPR_PJ TaxID=2738375 RepID=UPI0035293A0D
MKKENAYTLVASDGERQDDISALRDAFSLRAFRYTDIAREERLAAIIARWPLLVETATEQPGRTR